jgi:ABC-type transport system involved in cytochrome c biogenesis permease subunit
MTMARRLIDGLASLRLAVVLMSVLAGVCTAATVYESRYGTPAAQREFYGTQWFAGLLAVLGVNVLLSMLRRWPWKTHQAGFVMAHVGILLVLAGSLVSIRFGIDGSLSLAEGDTGAEVALPQRSVRISLPDGARHVVPVTHAGEFWGEERHPLGPDVTLVLTRHQPHVAYHEHLEEAPGGVPAIDYHFEGAGLEPVAGQLVADDPAQGRADFGPVAIVFLLATPEHPADTLLQPPTDQPHAIFVADGGHIRYALSSRKGAVATGEVVPGQAIATPWMDLKLVVDTVRPSVKRDRHITASRAPAAESQRRPAVEVRLEQAGQAGEPTWVAWGEVNDVVVGGRPARVSFGDASVTLPFRVELLKFKSEKYPGSAMAATYESRVRIDDPEQGSFERVISMNNPLHHRGYTLFQSSFAEGERMVSVFSVSRAPGLPVVYLGTCLLVLGVAWMFYVKPWLARRQGQRMLALRMASTAAVLLAVASPAAAADDPWGDVRRIPVQDGGRVKPLDTFAREAARRITGGRAFGSESVKGLEPVAWIVSTWADPRKWSNEPIVAVSDAALRSFVELPASKDRFTFAELTAHEPFLRVAEQARQKQQDGAAQLAPQEQAALRLYDTLWLLSVILSAESPRVLPVVDGEWRGFHDLAGSAETAAVAAAWRDLAEAQRSADPSRIRPAAAALRKALPTPDPALATALEREIRYNVQKPFRASTLIYLVALLALFASLPLASQALGRFGLLATAAGFAVHTYGFALRTVVAGRAPVTNMYESIVFAAWGAVALALVFALKDGARLFAACAASVAVPFLLIADNVPLFDAAIDPLAPVLRDNFWLTTHVLTITLGYAALFLAMAMGHGSLALIWTGWGGEARLRTLSGFIHRVLQAGTLLLAAGTLLGGVWASYSWGRFWGWDPKETWALIALLVYLAILHARFVGWLKDAGLAVGSILGALSVVMAWYGVNYVLGTGLHSYGFGSGGGNAWVAGYAAVEVLLVAAVLWRGRPKTTTDPGLATATHSAA